MYSIGEVIEIEVQALNSASALFTPATYSLKYKYGPGGTYAELAVTNPSTGVYKANLTLSSSPVFLTWEYTDSGGRKEIVPLTILAATLP